jgi:hypothetical protein
MAKYEVHVHNSILTVRVPGEDAVSIGFIASGQPLALKLDPHGKIAPALEAEHYVTVVDGQPVRTQTEEQFLDELSRALGAGMVTWQRE